MDNLFFAGIDVLNFVLVIVLYWKVRSRIVRRRTLADEALFHVALVPLSMMILSDMIMWIVDGKLFCGARFINLFCGSVFYAMGNIPSFIWMVYCHYKIDPDWEILQSSKWSKCLLIPLLVGMGLAVTSPMMGGYFRIDVHNTYTRGPLYPIYFAINIFYLSLPILRTLRLHWEHKEHTRRELYDALVLFAVFPALAMTFQIVFPLSPAALFATVLFTFTVFINYDKPRIYTDLLTGLYNYCWLSEWLGAKLHHIRPQEQFFLMVLQLEQEQSIALRLGRRIGDQALIQCANVLLSCCMEQDDYVVRLPDSSFVIAGTCTEEKEIDKLCADIHNAFISFNEWNQVPYELSVSIDCAVYGSRKMNSAADFLQFVQGKMRKNMEKCAWLSNKEIV